eukprot:IDg20661t1
MSSAEPSVRKIAHSLWLAQAIGGACAIASAFEDSLDMKGTAQKNINIPARAEAICRMISATEAPSRAIKEAKLDSDSTSDSSTSRGTKDTLQEKNDSQMEVELTHIAAFHVLYSRRPLTVAIFSG